jgi:hypothetical protein
MRMMRHVYNIFVVVVVVVGREGGRKEGNFPFPFQIDRLWSSGQSSWLQIQRSGFDSRHYQIFWEVVGLERGPFSLVITVEKLLGKKNSGFCLESREYGRRDPSHWSCDTSQSAKVGTNFADKRRSQATEFFLFHIILPSTPTSSRLFLLMSWSQNCEFRHTWK